MLALEAPGGDAVDWLVGHGVLSPDGAAEVRRLAALWGADAIDAAIATGAVAPEMAAEALSEVSGNALLDPQVTRLDARLLSPEDLRAFRGARFLPWCRRNGRLLIAAVNPHTAKRDVARWLGNSDFDIAATTERILLAATEEALSLALVERAIHGLADADASFSARRSVTLVQALLGIGLFTLGVSLFAEWPATSTAVANIAAGAFFLTVLLFRLFLLLAGLGTPAKQNPSSVSAKDLPNYSLLVALYDEAELLPQLIESLGALDYPATRLEILLLLEASDSTTRAALRAFKLDGRFGIVTVPDRLPRTKPKACNYGLCFARGDYIALFDAEDRPEPRQLLRALEAFRRDPATTCVQARLSFYNASENWLTRQFAIEFALWFGFLLPGLSRLGLPIPLGGTSNHFRREVLDAAGAWDAFNVTEDADLGIRLARLQHRVSVIASDTAEEANCEVINWINQRSRWLKGYLQTWFVHMRSPARLWRELGWAGFLSFQLLIGGAVLSALLHLVFWANLLLSAFSPQSDDWRLGLLVLGAGYGIAILCGMIAALHPSLEHRGLLMRSAVMMPLYWFLISFAAIKALISFASRPYYWAKTRHGLSRVSTKARSARR